MTKKKKKIKKNDEDEEKIKERLRSLGYAWKTNKKQRFKYFKPHNI